MATNLLPELRRCRRESPTTDMFAFVRIAPQSVRTALAATSEGLLAGAVSDNIADLETVLQSRICCDSNRESVAERIAEAGAAHVPPKLQPVVRWCAMRSDKNLRVTHLVQATGTDRKALSNALRKAGMPKAQTLIGWHRSIHAVSRLCGSVQSVARIANDLEFPSQSDLSHLLGKYLRTTPTNARNPASLNDALSAYAHALATFEPVAKLGRVGIALVPR